MWICSSSAPGGEMGDRGGEYPGATGQLAFSKQQWARDPNPNSVRGTNTWGCPLTSINRLWYMHIHTLSSLPLSLPSPFLHETHTHTPYINVSYIYQSLQIHLHTIYKYPRIETRTEPGTMWWQSLACSGAHFQLPLIQSRPSSRSGTTHSELVPPKFISDQDHAPIDMTTGQSYWSIF